jgi:DNA-binding NarL/FixJ family response regulator
MRALDQNGQMVLVSFSLGRLMGLTRSELDVVRWAHAGHSNGAIARERRTVIHTVARQMAESLRKLGIGARLWLATIPELSAWSPPYRGTRAVAGIPIDSLLSRNDRQVDRQEAARIWREIASGQWIVLAGVDAGGLRHAVMSRDSTKPIDWRVLTTTHRNVLALVEEGFAQKVIAMKLGMAPSTVSAVLASAQKRLGFRSLSQLLRAYCAASDLIDRPAGVICSAQPPVERWSPVGRPLYAAG